MSNVAQRSKTKLGTLTFNLRFCQMDFVRSVCSNIYRFCHDCVPVWLCVCLFVCLVGAGSAGCVLASRLSEDPDVSVLLLEAGGSEEDTFMIRMPFAALELQNTEVDWAYRTQPQRKACLGMDQQVRFYLFQLYNNLTLQSSTGRGFPPWLSMFYVLWRLNLS